MTNYPRRILLKIKKPNDGAWRYGDKIEIKTPTETIVYRSEIKYNNAQYFLKDSDFIEHLLKTREAARSRTKSPDFLELRQKLKNLKIKSGCRFCGYNKCAEVLCFDHLDPNSKIDGINKLMKKYSGGSPKRKLAIIEVIFEEINKCQILCANCHYEKTYTKQDGSDKFTRKYTTSKEFIEENNGQDICFLSFNENEFNEAILERQKYSEKRTRTSNNNTSIKQAIQLKIKEIDSRVNKQDHK